MATARLDEMATRIGVQQHWLWRAVDEHGQTLDVLLQKQRDTAAAERFFRRLLLDDHTRRSPSPPRP